MVALASLIVKQKGNNVKIGCGKVRLATLSSRASEYQLVGPRFDLRLRMLFLCNVFLP